MRETLISLIREQGYDTWTACTLADQTLAEFRAGTDRERTYHVGKASFTLRRSNA